MGYVSKAETGKLAVGDRVQLSCGHCGVIEFGTVRAIEEDDDTLYATVDWDARHGELIDVRAIDPLSLEPGAHSDSRIRELWKHAQMDGNIIIKVPSEENAG